MTARAPSPVSTNELLDYRLSLRLGPIHARQRLGIEREYESRVFGQDHHSFHLENWTSAPRLIRVGLRLCGLLNRARDNSRDIQVVEHRVHLPDLPEAFEGYRILHLSDLHVDMDELNLKTVINIIGELDYHLCVLTGDYRKLTWGPIEPALHGMERLRQAIHGTPMAVLGNHDSIRMLPPLEDMGYQMLLNENAEIERDGASIYVAGVDDAHFFKAHNLQKAGDDIPSGAISLLLSHTPEIWREAGHAGYDLFLCGHTHGGQICLPGGIPVTLDSSCPRSLGRGYWRFNGMQGYTSPGCGTSVLNVRLNCPPEIIIHTLTRGPR
ncbi:metallophosphoesterase [Marinobacter mobilis]|uniref:Calcineurin-like phosphoesterase domain-containing protein n=1 Tax=Marinobacter mobilis TaxID=488533 RepID=A0A1H3AUB4_9GAMM|nr:metallophosphoesterase [Marinobacter mobilis]SDX33195.1 hypothetical protein SAMN04487960_108103 [Marinobacter mobilis]